MSRRSSDRYLVNLAATQHAPSRTLGLPRLGASAAPLAVTAAGCLAADANGVTGNRLHPRQRSDTPALFESVPSSATGLEQVNSFDDPRSWGELFRAFNNGSLGTGVAVADFDRDGRSDIAAVTKSGLVSLYRNLGGFRFEDVTTSAGLVAHDAGGSGVLGWFKSAIGSGSSTARPWMHGVVFADIDNDGWLDLYICRFGAPNLLYMNRGDGTFSEEAAARGLALSDASVVAAFCDYDRDGWLDVYVQTNLLDDLSGPDGQRDHLLRNRGGGIFVDASDKLAPRIPSQGHSCAWWDFDDDGWPDLYVANDFAGPDLLYRNQGDGSFVDVARQVLPYTPFSSMGCDTADVDGDGLIDLFVADMAATSHEKDQRTMAAARYLAPAPRPGEAPQLSRNMLYLGSGMMRVREAAYLAGLAASDWTWSPRFEDVDCDGRVDVLITNGMNREHHNVDLHDRANRLASLDQRAAVFRDSPALPERNLAFRNEGDLRFSEVGDLWGFNEIGIAFGSAAGDFDGDGDLDWVVSRYNDTPAVYRNGGDEGDRVVVRLKGTESNRFGIGAMVRLETASGWQVREIWTARGYQSSSEPAAFFGFPAGESPRQVRVEWPSGRIESWGPLQAGFAYELIEGTGRSGEPRLTSVPVFERLGDADRESPESASSPTIPLNKSTRLQPIDLSYVGPGMAVADLDRDGREEIVLGGKGRTGISRVGPDLRLSSLDAPFRSENGREPALEDGPMLLFDADHDGFTDLLVSRTGERAGAPGDEYALRLWMGDGRGGFRAAGPDMIPARPISAGAIAAADFDRDGALDLFVGSRVLPNRYPKGGDSMLLRQSGLAWINVCREIAPGLTEAGMVSAALWSDVDDDGWIDLVVACEWGRLRCFFNTRSGQLLERPGEDPFAGAGTGWWSSLAAVDFNRDGRLDYLAGNAGLNTHYRAGVDQPAILLQLPAGRSRTATALLEVYHQDGHLYPWRTRRDLGSAWPAVLRKFSSNNSFAPATVEEIFGADVIAGAERWSAQELRSGIFMSRPGGRFEFVPLPNPCQIAPVYGIAAGDLDGDGLADACLLQNSTGQVSGSWQGGLGQFLRGRGDGTFDAVVPRESGFVVPGEGRGLAVFDPAGTGRPILAATQKMGPPLFFAAAGRNDFLSLRLHQPGRNPEALGARVEVTWSDQHTTATEVSGCAGYMTQTSQAIYLGLGGRARPVSVMVRWPEGMEVGYDLPQAPGSYVLDREQARIRKP